MFTKTLLTLTILSFASLGFSDNRSDYNYPARGFDEECPPTPQKPVCPDDCTSSRQRIEDMQDRVITPDAGPRVCAGADLIITADFIYWHVREDGLAFAETGTTSTSGITATNATRGSVFRPNFYWEPGFKVGLGLGFNHDGWDFTAQYTWLRSNPSRKTIIRDPVNPINALKNTWDLKGLFTDDALLSASANWSMHFNVIDAELGRNYYISKYLTLRPFAGFKGTWQDDDYTVRYQENLSSIGVITLFDPLFRMRNNVDYWGFGVRVGSNNAWYFVRNFCLFGDWALSALLSKYDLRRKDFATPDSRDLDETSLERNQSWDWYSVKAVLELTIGLRYDVWWSNDDYHFAFSAGWEEQIWFSHNQHFSVLEEAAHGDMALQGLTVKARFDF